MQTAVKIRRMKLEDVISVTRLHRNTIRKINSQDYPKHVIKIWSGRNTVSWLRENFTTEQRYVAVFKEQIVGFINVSKDGKTLEALYVHHNYIGRGVGSALMKKAEQIIQKSGAKKMIVTSSLTARTFYEKHGFKIVKPVTDLIRGVKIKGWKMSKDLR